MAFTTYKRGSIALWAADLQLTTFLVGAAGAKKWKRTAPQAPKKWKMGRRRCRKVWDSVIYGAGGAGKF